MPEPKHFLIAANTEHSYATGIFMAVPAIGAFLKSLLTKTDLPHITWDISSKTGEITVSIDNVGKVHSAYVWWANSCGVNSFDQKNRKDYRIAHTDQPCTCGIAYDGYCTNFKSLWSKTELNVTVNAFTKKRELKAHVQPPVDDTWVAYFIDMKFSTKNGMTLNTKEIMENTVFNNAKHNKRVHDQGDFDFGGIPHDLGGFLEFTSEVSVFPQTFPYEDCSGASCKGTLV